MSDISQPPPVHPPTTPEQRERGRYMRTTREAIGKSMGEMAREIGWSVTMVSNLERGFTELRPEENGAFTLWVNRHWSSDAEERRAALLASKPVELPTGDDLRGLAAREAAPPARPTCPWCGHDLSLVDPHLSKGRNHELGCPAYYGDAQDRSIVAYCERLAKRLAEAERALSDVGAKLRALERGR